MNENENRAVTMQIRADEQTKAQFAELCTALGQTQGAAMQALLHLYELEQAKGVIAGSADVIDEVRSHADSIINAFVGLLERNQNADNRIRQEYAAALDSKDKTIISLQEQLDAAKQTTKTAAQTVQEIKEQAEQQGQAAVEQIAQLIKQVESAETARQQAERTAAAAETARTAMQNTIDTLKEQLAAERKKEERVTELEQELTESRKTISDLSKQVSDGAAELERAKAAAELAAERAENDKKAAVLAERNTIAELKAVAADERGKLYAQIDELRNEIAKRNTVKG